ncbi:hypothetical protein SAMN04487866_10264 [Thermoactinomyces sp. DSM 45891]|uniref:hypothetical protein n=1 Tax=Thermoactinomyces sp. DSM 45891 TaxID=1761907 RepID=UPI000917E4EA|nr:hypothetical protein [Thermoactinomyces sp. DSM 45891]SFX18576.1 hypothetical protein SAMN04487866_10264 [Thermoactinomyces sp. DSM 45891]
MEFLYDKQNRLTKIIDGIDRDKSYDLTRLETYQFEYHPTLTSLITKVTDSRGNPTSFDYHTSGDLAKSLQDDQPSK